MPGQALYLKWRPTTFDDVVGQEHVTRTLRNSLKTGRIRHAYLFSGPRGTGKTTTARLLAKAVNCQHEDYAMRPCNECHACIAVNEGRYLDLIEIDAATHTGVDDVRDLREKIAFTPGEGRFKIYIIDEVHRFSGSAFDALLKTLEEPPDHAIFVLATTEIDKVPQTIKSRCLQFDFRRVSLMEVADRLELIASNEGLNIERGALELIARQGTGSVRDSISLLDQIVSDPEEHITLADAQRILGTANTHAVMELVEALVSENVPRGLHVINEAIDSGSDPRQFGQQVVEHLRSVMLAQTAGADLLEASQEEQAMYTDQASMIDRATLLRAVRIFNEAVNDFKGGWQPQLALELALIESLQQPEQVVVQQVVQQTMGRPAAGQGTVPPVADEPPPAPGTPPLVPAATITEQWTKMLNVLHKLNKTAPDVVKHFRVYQVEGNMVTLVTDNRLYFDRLNVPAKLDIVSAALSQTHREHLRARVMMVDDLATTATVETVTPANVEDDPVLSAGLEVGGKVKSTRKKKQS